MFRNYYYPYYRTYPVAPYWPAYPAYPAYPYANYGINAYQSQIGNQSIVNTGVATDISQVFSPTAIY